MVTAQQINGRLVDLDTGSHIKIVPELVARCRTTCIEKFLPHSENMVAPANACRDTSQCSMCWDFCNFLYKEKSDVFKNICTNYTCVSVHLDYYICLINFHSMV